MGGLKYLLTMSRLTYWTIIEAGNNLFSLFKFIDDQTSLFKAEWSVESNGAKKQ